LFNTSKLQDALADFDKAVELDPKNGELRRHRSLALSQLRQYDNAIADLEEAVRLNPADQLECKKLLGINWLYKSLEHQKNLRWKEAIANLNVAIKWEAAAVHFHQRGVCYLNLKEHEKAVADFTEAIKREPDVARHYEKRALAYHALGRAGEAMADLEKAASLKK
jgi:tetratricopeptide (TPR) repeat protein